MNDHEYAALAAGYGIRFDNKVKAAVITDEKDSWANARWWEPKDRDADAFRLMVDAGINVQPSEISMTTGWREGMSDCITCTIVDDDHKVSARHAIFQCAVAIGKQLHKDKSNEG